MNVFNNIIVFVMWVVSAYFIVNVLDLVFFGRMQYHLVERDVNVCERINTMDMIRQIYGFLIFVVLVYGACQILKFIIFQWTRNDSKTKRSF